MCMHLHNMHGVMRCRDATHQLLLRHWQHAFPYGMPGQDITFWAWGAESSAPAQAQLLVHALVPRWVITHGMHLRAGAAQVLEQLLHAVKVLVRIHLEAKTGTPSAADGRDQL